MSRLLTATALAAAVAFSAPAWAATQNFQAHLTGASEVPPKTGGGAGDALVALDTSTGTIHYTVQFHGLSGPATMAHIHGPAPAGKNAGVVVPLGNNPVSPIVGSAKLTPAQVKELQSGMMYVNVHTAENPGGEIRGQLKRAK